ncbi:MAG UNVERIFIED_CONTAM: hypothetical protein LVR29_25215 [Microcystis novacekii LVE1205-3]|jgi:nitrate/nitrite transport system substrate-binding protein
MQGNIDFGDGRKIENSPVAMKFWADNASYPYKSHDTWFVTEDIRWGYIPADTDIKALVDKVNREDIWREVAKLSMFDRSNSYFYLLRCGNFL